MTVIQFNGTEVNRKIEELKSNGCQDADIVRNLINQGYTLDSFRYDPERYAWFKKHFAVVNLDS